MQRRVFFFRNGAVLAFTGIWGGGEQTHIPYITTVWGSGNMAPQTECLFSIHRALDLILSIA